MNLPSVHLSIMKTGGARRNLTISIGYLNPIPTLNNYLFNILTITLRERIRPSGVSLSNM